MIHLFNKTYLDIHNFIDNSENRIVVSDQHGTGMLGALVTTASGNLYASVKSVDVLLDGEEGNFSSWGQFFEFCYDANESEDRRLIIYADKDAYAKILSALHKFIFANPDATSSYKAYKASYARDLLIAGREVFYLEDQLVQSLISAEDYATAFAAVTVDTASADSVSAFNKIKQKHSLEFLVASYLYDNSQVEMLKPILLNMVRRFVEEQFKEALTSYKMNILKPSLQSKLGTSSYTIDNIETMLDDAALAVLKRTNAWRAAPGVGIGPRTPLDLTTYTADEIATLKSQVKIFNTYINSPDAATVEKVYDRITQYIDIIADNTVSNADVESILDYEANSNDDDRFWALGDKANVNIYLLDYFLLQKQNSNTASLASYLLRT